MKQTKNSGTTLILRNISEIKEVFYFLNNLSLKSLIVKYKVDHYVKEFHTKDLIKIAVLFFYSKERHLKHFLNALLKNSICCKLFKIPEICVQQVYKALKNRCWWFFYEAFNLIVKEVKKKETISQAEKTEQTAKDFLA